MLEVRQQARRDLGENEAAVFDAHIGILHDSAFKMIGDSTQSLVLLDRELGQRK